MKKKLLAVILIVTMLGSLVGCRAMGQAVGRMLKGKDATSEASSEADSDTWVVKEIDSEEPAIDADAPVETVPANYDGILYSTERYDDFAYDDAADISLAYCNLEKLILDADGAYSVLANQVNSDSEKVFLGYKDRFNEMKQWAEEESKEEYFYGPYYLSNSHEVVRADANLFTFLNHYEDYTGGAHGYYYSEGCNYDSQTGKKLGWRDVFNLTDAEMEDLLIQRLQRDYLDAVEGFGYEETVRQKVVGETDEYGSTYDLNFYADYQGVTFIFNPYEISYYAAGIIEVPFSYAEYGNLMNAKYTSVPDNYCISFMGYDYAPFIYDFTGDGQTDTVTVVLNDDGYGDYDSATITVNGNSQDVESWGWSVSPLLVVRKGGNNQLVLRTVAENDWHINHVYSIAKDGTLTKINEFTGYADNMINPDCFPHSEHFDMLGTFYAMAPSRFEADGSVTKLTNYYEVEWDVEITSITSLEFAELDSKGGRETGNTVTIPAGSTYHLNYTDGVDTLYATVNGNTYIKIKLEPSTKGWGWNVNGQDEYDCFETLPYAG